MKFESIQDLPDILRDVMPEDAQKIYMEAYNSAWENYEEEEGGELNRDGVAHRQGIHAVENEYLLDQKTGNWVPREKAEEYLEEREEEQEEDTGTLGDIADISK
jgi:cation transport regulator